MKSSREVEEKREPCSLIVAPFGKMSEPSSSENHEVDYRSSTKGASEMNERAQNTADISRSESREDVSHRDRGGEREDASHDSTPRKKAGPPLSSSSSSSSQVTGAQRKGKKPQMDSQPHQQQMGRFYPSRQPPQGHFPMGAGLPQGPGPYGPPYPYAGGNGHYPPPHYHHTHPHYHSQVPPMPHFNGGPYSAHAMGNHQRGGGNGGAGNGPYSSHYGSHSHPYASNMAQSYSSHGMHSSYPNMPASDSASISSKGSKSSKKRTIDGVHEPPHAPISAPHVYTFRRTDSNSSSTSTVTAGNNTSIETHGTEESHGRHESHHPSHQSEALGPTTAYDDHDSHYNEGRPIRTRYNHRRECSADASTTSSLSAGFSLESYDGPRGTLYCSTAFVYSSFDVEN